MILLPISIKNKFLVLKKLQDMEGLQYMGKIRTTPLPPKNLTLFEHN